MRDALDVLDLTLVLPVGGKTYRVDPPPAAVGVRLVNMLGQGIILDALADAGITGTEWDAAHDALTIDTETSPDFARDCLGAAYDQMLADDLPHPVIELAVSTAFLCWTAGKAAAEAWWESGGKAPAPSTSGRRTATPTLRAGANTTRKRASRSGTTRKKRARGSR